MAQLSLAREVYRDKVHGAWVGRNAGSTLGSGVAGRTDAQSLSFYEPAPGQPAASESLDLQLLALSALLRIGPDLGGSDIADLWQSHITYSFDEMGYARRNLDRGLRPPVSGAFDNWFGRALGAAARSQLWGMVAPGAPQVAAAYAYEDARIDHAAEGVWAAMYWASVQSAAFFVSDIGLLLNIGASAVPQNSRVAQAARVARETLGAGLSWLEARTRVLAAVGHPNYSDAAQNVGFGAIGLLYGRKDFGASLCAAVNCGCDADGVGAIVGGVLGAVLGRSCLPAAWADPIGDSVVVGWGLVDLPSVQTCAQLAERTMEAGEQVVAARCVDVELSDEVAPAVEAPASTGPETPADAAAPETPADAVIPDTPTDAPAPETPAAETAEPTATPVESDTEPPAADAAPAVTDGGVAPVGAPPAPVADGTAPQVNWTDNTALRALLSAPSNSSTHHVGPYEFVVDYGDAGPAIVPNVATTIMVTIRNRGSEPFVGMVQLSAPRGWEVRVPGAQGQRQMLAAGGMARYGFVVRAPDSAPPGPANELTVVMTPEQGPPTAVPMSLLGGSRWHLVGPFKNQYDDGFERSYEPEDKPGLDNSYLGRAGGLVHWQRLAFKETVLDLEPHFDGQPGVLYLRTRLHLPTVTDARIVFHTNDGGKVWLDDHLVLQRHWHAAFRPTLGEGPCMADVTLRAGDNALTVKVVRCKEPIEVAVMLADRRGQALDACVGAWF